MKTIWTARKSMNIQLVKYICAVMMWSSEHVWFFPAETPWVGVLSNLHISFVPLVSFRIWGSGNAPSWSCILKSPREKEERIKRDSRSVGKKYSPGWYLGYLKERVNALIYIFMIKAYVVERLFAAVSTKCFKNTFKFFTRFKEAHADHTRCYKQ